MSDSPQAEPEHAVIAAESESQALDWQLVLASQDIAGKSSVAMASTLAVAGGSISLGRVRLGCGNDPV